MRLIASYRNAGYEALADGVIAFFDRRPDLQRRGVAFSSGARGRAAAAASPTRSPPTSAWWRSTAAIRRPSPWRR